MAQMQLDAEAVKA